MSTKSELTETRREQILEAATSVFARLGVHTARMDDIVEEAGLSKGAVYWYFKSKDEIIKSILEIFLNRELHGLHELVEQDGSVDDRLILMVDHLITELKQYETVMPIAYEIYALSTRESDVRKSLNTYFQRFIQTFEDLIAQGIKRGEIKKVDPNEAAVSIVALLEGLTLLWIVGVLRINIEKLGSLIQSSLHLFIHGLRKETN
jgi:AcrR family transcriptional regulator